MKILGKKEIEEAIKNINFNKIQYQGLDLCQVLKTNVIFVKSLII